MFAQRLNKVLFVFLGLSLATCQQCGAPEAVDVAAVRKTGAKSALKNSKPEKPGFVGRTQDKVFNSRTFKKLPFGLQTFFRSVKGQIISLTVTAAGLAVVVVLGGLGLKCFVFDKFRKNNQPEEKTTQQLQKEIADLQQQEASELDPAKKAKIQQDKKALEDALSKKEPKVDASKAQPAPAASDSSAGKPAGQDPAKPASQDSATPPTAADAAKLAAEKAAAQKLAAEKVAQGEKAKQDAAAAQAEKKRLRLEEEAKKTPANKLKRSMEGSLQGAQKDLDAQKAHEDELSKEVSSLTAKKDSIAKELEKVKDASTEEDRSSFLALQQQANDVAEQLVEKTKAATEVSKGVKAAEKRVNTLTDFSENQVQVRRLPGRNMVDDSSINNVNPEKDATVQNMSYKSNKSKDVNKVSRDDWKIGQTSAPTSEIVDTWKKSKPEKPTPAPLQVPPDANPTVPNPESSSPPLSPATPTAPSFPVVDSVIVTVAESQPAAPTPVVINLSSIPLSQPSSAVPQVGGSDAATVTEEKQPIIPPTPTVTESKATPPVGLTVTPAENHDPAAQNQSQPKTPAAKSGAPGAKRSQAQGNSQPSVSSTTPSVPPKPSGKGQSISGRRKQKKTDIVS